MSESYPPPRLVFWETTAGCNLSCVHCRRVTIADQLIPEDLSEQEALGLVDDIAAFANPILVLSGGEPLMRPDIFDVARHAADAGLIVALATNGTMIDRPTATAIKRSGVRRVSISFDGPDAASHDSFRGEGAFNRALAGIAALQAADVPFQINTTVAKHNVDRMEETLQFAMDVGAVGLHLFLLVPVGCGVEISDTAQISPASYEATLQWLYDAERAVDLQLKATCAPHYFRVVRQRQAADRRAGLDIAPPPSAHRQHRAGGHPGSGGASGGPPSMHAMTRGCLAGTGVCFISHKGDVYPCGYLPVSAGSVREESLAHIWQEALLFRQLRDPNLLQGKCGLCEFKQVCGGCRARAYGTSGDLLAEEPFCTYQPGRVA